MSRLFPLFVVFLLLLSSCDDNKIVSDKDKFAELYVDLQINIEQNREKPDQLKRGMDSILKKYNVTREQYYNTIENLGYDKEKWEEFFTIVNKRLNSLKKQG